MKYVARHNNFCICIKLFIYIYFRYTKKNKNVKNFYSI